MAVTRSPVLVFSAGGSNWIERDSIRYVPWVCHAGLARAWDLRGFTEIRLCGSPDPVPGAIRAKWTSDNRYRHPPYYAWLDRIGPTAWVWIEEA